MKHFLTKLLSTIRIVTTLAMARTFGHYEVSVHDEKLSYARYRYRGKTYAFPTGPLIEDKRPTIAELLNVRARITPHYLTNTEKRPWLVKLVAEAAKLSGQDVRLQNGPMPDVYPYTGYNREALLDTHDCIVGYDKTADYSKFWNAMRTLENRRATHDTA